MRTSKKAGWLFLIWTMALLVPAAAVVACVLCSGGNKVNMIGGEFPGGG